MRIAIQEESVRSALHRNKVCKKRHREWNKNVEGDSNGDTTEHLIAMLEVDIGHNFQWLVAIKHLLGERDTDNRVVLQHGEGHCL